MIENIENELTLNADSVLYKALFALKRLTRQRISGFEISLFIDELMKVDNLNLKLSALFILAFSKLNKKKKKYLLEDCAKFFKVMSGHVKTSHTRRILTKADDVHTSNSVIDDIDAETIKGATKSLSELNLQSDCDNLIDFGLDEPEMVRETSIIQSDAFIGSDLSMIKDQISFKEDSNKESSLQINKTKKRKIIEDKVTEFTPTDYTNINRTNYKSNENSMFSYPNLIHISKDIEEFLKQEIKNNIELNKSIEQERFQVTIEEPNFEATFNNFIPEISSTSFIDFNEFGREFNFNEMIANKSQNEKANAFYELLTRCFKGQLNVKQTESFGPILCKQK
ncbi:hypothetical protein A0H76_1919 [Hepatospora eriocheir]|uniref:Rad21/Rec8-like protein N-terminal domain-containing protein n=1 Tax=Hepatospora eriocheir TaxID=1081669 RepID=A0A1X0QG75_9MICR|nr:hypothetical protein A0H76_1919 [Hepatospora eriocheir]